MRKYKLRFNQLLFQYHKYSRKLANLRFQNKNVRRQHLLEKRIVQLFEKLLGLKKAIGMGVAAATAVVGLSLASPQAAQAQSFDGPQANPFGIALQPDSNVTFPTFTDLDGDGDMDMLSGSYYGNFYYYKNTGTATNPVFASPTQNPFGLTALPSGKAAFPRFVDMDGDGDMDILIGAYYSGFYYYENTGTANAPAFAAPIQNPFGLSVPPSSDVAFPTVADLDNDGDMDLLALGGYNGEILYYYENTGTANAAAFAAPIQNQFGVAPATNGYLLGFPAIADLDHDGDMDLLTCGEYVSFNYYENTGSANMPNFTSPVTNPFGLFGLPNAYVAIPTFVDIDGDGDMDIMAGGSYGYFTFYKNTSPTGIKGTEPVAYKIYPNPVLDVLHVSGAQALRLVNLYSIDGRLLSSTKSQGNATDISIDFAKCPKGTYLVELHFKSGQVSAKLVSK